MNTTTTHATPTVSANGNPVWLTGRVYYRYVQAYEHTAHNGKTYQMLSITLPEGTSIDGRDMTGWTVNVIASRYSLDAIEARSVMPFSVKSDANLWVLRGQQRCRISGRQLVEALHAQYQAYLDSRNKTLQTANAGYSQVQEQWHIVNALISEPEAYRLTDAAERLLATAARDITLTVKLEQLCRKAAQAYLTGRYTPQAMMQATHMIISQFAQAAARHYTAHFDQQDIWQTVISVLDVLVDPVNKAIYELLNHPAVNPHVRAAYIKDTQTWVGAYVADYMLCTPQARATYEFTPFNRKNVTEALSIFASSQYPDTTVLL